MKPIEKVVSYQQIMIKVPTNLAKLPTYTGTQDLLSSSNLHFWRNYWNSQTHKQHFWLKSKRTEKVTNIVCQLLTYFDKRINNSAQDANMSCNTKFVFFFKAMVLEKLLNFQTHKQGRLVQNEANSKKYQHYQLVTNILW